MSSQIQPRKRRFGISRRLFAGILLIIAMIAIAVYVTRPPATGAQSQALGPATVGVTRGRIVGTVLGSGTIAAEQTVDLGFQQNGVVKTVTVEAGDVVQAGQVLADLDTTGLQLTLATAQAALNLQSAKYDQTRTGPSQYDVANAQAAVESAQATYDAAVRKNNVNDAQLRVARANLDKAAVALQKAKSDYDRAVADGKTDLIAVTAARQQAQIDYESAVANGDVQVASINDASVRTADASLNTAKTNLAKLQAGATAQDAQIAQAQLEQAKIAVQQAQVSLRNAQLLAPFAGVVTAVNIAPGSSASSAQPAVKLMNRATLHVNLKLSENDVVKAQNNQPVDLSIDSLSGWKAQGAVIYIAPASETSNGVVTYAVRVGFDGKDARLKVGMTANVSIITALKDGVLLVPNSALLPKGVGHIVQVVDLAGRTTDVDVETGISDGTQTEIISGVGEGTRVAALPGNNVRRPAGPFGGGG